jgi:hypothetical protein
MNTHCNNNKIPQFNALNPHKPTIFIYNDITHDTVWTCDKNWVYAQKEVRISNPEKASVKAKCLVGRRHRRGSNHIDYQCVHVFLLGENLKVQPTESQFHDGRNT